MDEELKDYMDAMEARIMAALERLRADLVADVESHAEEKRGDAMARKFDGES